MKLAMSLLKLVFKYEYFEFTIFIMYSLEREKETEDETEKLPAGSQPKCCTTGSSPESGSEPVARIVIKVSCVFGRNPIAQPLCAAYQG